MSDEIEEEVNDEEVDDEEDSSEPSEDDLIDSILGDDDYTDDSYTDEERDDLEESEEEEPEEETEEEDADEEEERDPELEGLLDLRDEQDEEEEASGEVDPHKITDEEIAMAVYQSSDYEGWLEAAQAEGRVPDDQFAAMVGKNRIDSSMLVENGIFDMGDMYSYMKGLRENQDPDRLVVPSTENEEEWRAFLKEGFNVPEEAEGYKDDLFAETYLAGEEFKDDRDDLRKMFHDNMFSEEQAYAMIEKYDDYRRNYHDSQIQEKNDYIAQERAAIEKEYGEDTRAVMKDAIAFIKKYGPEFDVEYHGEKIKSSSAFIRMINRALNDSAAPERLQLKQAAVSIQSLTPSGLEKMRDALIERREKYMPYKNDGSRKDMQKKLKSATIKLNKVLDEINKRGLVDG